jgi:WD40 repeat protein
MNILLNGSALKLQEKLIVCGEGPDVEIHSISEKKLLTKFKAHEKRVKAACVTSLGMDASYLITASNDGFVKMWKISVIFK